MNEKRIALATRVELVRAAIQRIKDTDQRYRDTQLDPYADSDDRGAALDVLRHTEREFQWQWENVEAILDSVLPNGAQTENAAR